MKKLNIFCILCLGLNSINAQDIGNLLLAGDDASLLSENYLNPAISGMMSGRTVVGIQRPKPIKNLDLTLP